MKTIQFFSTIPGVADAAPIIKARDYVPGWVNAMRADYKKEMEKGDRGAIHTYRCPGIFDIMREGFLLTLPWDLDITTTDDDWGFEWLVPKNEIMKLMEPIPPVQAHTKAAEHLPVPPGALKSIIKLNTPWHVKVPKDIKFIMLPVSYDDQMDFQQVPGILDPTLSSEINFQLRWFKKNGTCRLKAGTPIAQLIPLSEENFNLECRDANSWDELWIKKRTFLNTFTFTLNRKTLQRAYKKHFGIK